MTAAEFNWAAAREVADRLVFEHTGCHLKDIEIAVLQSSWEDISYEQMAKDYGYSAEYLNKDVGNKLWIKLAECLGEKVSKRNFKEALRRAWQQPQTQTETGLPARADSFYLERPALEKRCWAEIDRPGCLLRIKAPLQTGKTELMSRLLHDAEQRGYRTVQLNLRDATIEDFNNLERFLQWLCTSINETLSLNYPVLEHWEESLGNSKIKCKTYFEKALLVADFPLFLAIDEVDKMFRYPEIAADFLGMLRTWHEDAKIRPSWSQLRLLLLHSQAYTQLDINQSPFNAGTEINLPDLTIEQVQLLAQKYGLDWDAIEVKKLMTMVGGHPYLVGAAFKHLVRENISLEEFLSIASTDWGVYRYHFQKHSQNLSREPQLVAAFKQVILADIPVEFDSLLSREAAVKLNDLGLVKLTYNNAAPRYELYRLYFRQHY